MVSIVKNKVRNQIKSNCICFYLHLSEGAQKEISKDEYSICARCETYRPPRAHHCRICQRCVRRMDHRKYVNKLVLISPVEYFVFFLSRNSLFIPTGSPGQLSYLSGRPCSEIKVLFKPVCKSNWLIKAWKCTIIHDLYVCYS